MTTLVAQPDGSVLAFLPDRPGGYTRQQLLTQLEEVRRTMNCKEEILRSAAIAFAAAKGSVDTIQKAIRDLDDATGVF